MPEPQTDAPEALLAALGLCLAWDKVHTSSVYLSCRGESTPSPNPPILTPSQNTRQQTGQERPGTQIRSVS